METSPASPRLGIVMLDTRFPRPPGDIGNPATFRVPVQVERVAGALPRRVVGSADALRGAGLVPKFVDAARALADAGVDAITTSCGFLVSIQAELQRAVAVPVLSSSLLALPGLLDEDDAPVGVLTADAACLGREHLRAAGVHDDADAGRVVVEGMPAEGAFAAAVLDDAIERDEARVCDEAVAAAMRLYRRAPALRTIVLECTNLPPYEAAIAAATGVRVVSLLDLPPLRDWVAPGWRDVRR